MPADTLLSLCNYLVLPGWLLLLILPRWKFTLSVICTAVIPFSLGLVYTGLIVSQLGIVPESAGFGSLAEISAMLSNPYALAAGWIHYLAFDLFMGAWEILDSQKNDVSHWYVVPCLLLTLMLGPVGLALYLSIRGILTKKFEVYGGV